MIRAALCCIVAGIAVAPVTGASAQEAKPLAAASDTGNMERLLAARPRVDGTLTIDEAVAIALRESPLVCGAVADVKAAEGKWDAARAQTRPYLSANTFVSGGSNANIAPSPGTVPPAMIQSLPRNAFAAQNISAMYPLYTSGRLEALVRQASSLKEVSAANWETQRQEVSLMTRTAYREITAQRAMIIVQRARLNENTERLRLDRIRLQQEQIPAYYVTRDEAEAADAEQAVTDAERDAALAMLRLKSAMGVHPASKIEISSYKNDEAQPVAETVSRLTGDAKAPATPETELNALLRVAERNRPELAAASARVSNAAHGVAATRGNYGAQVSLFGMGDASKASGQKTFGGATIGLAASIPLYNGGQREADLRTVNAERDRARADEEQVALQIAQEVESALLESRAAEQNIGTARTALTAAQEEYEAAKVRYEAGRSIVTEVLDAQAARVRAQGNLAQAQFRLGTAQDQLLRTVGSER